MNEINVWGKKPEMKVVKCKKQPPTWKLFVTGIYGGFSLYSDICGPVSTIHSETFESLATSLPSESHQTEGNQSEIVVHYHY